MNSYLSKIGAGLIGLSALLYTGCSYVPVKIIENIHFNKGIILTQKDEQYIQNVKEIDKKLVKDNHPQKVDLGILVDEHFIKKYNDLSGDWWKIFNEKIKFVNNKFKEEFGIEFDVDSVEYIKVSDKLPAYDINAALAWIRLHYKPEQVDAFMFLSGVDYDGSEGLCKGLEGNHLVIAPQDYTNFMERIIQHELSHLFGAEDLKDSNSVMSQNFYSWSYEWSEDNADIIKDNKDRVLFYHDSKLHKIKKMILKFPEEDQLNVQVLFCYANAWKYHGTGFRLAKDMIKKYPDNELVEVCHDIIIELQKKMIKGDFP